MKKSEIKKLATEENKNEYKETEEKFIFCIDLLDISAWDDNADELVYMLEIELKAKTLNANEKAVLNYIIENGDDWCGGPTLHPSDIFIDELSKHQIAGYISDLWKKGHLMHSEMPNGVISWSAKTWTTI